MQRYQPDNRTHTYQGLLKELKACQQAVKERDEALAECYRQSGADSDGAPDEMLALTAVQEVTRMRQALDKYEGRTDE